MWKEVDIITKGMSKLYDAMDKIGMALHALRDHEYLIARGELEDGFSYLIEAVGRLEGEAKLTNSGLTNTRKCAGCTACAGHCEWVKEDSI